MQKEITITGQLSDKVTHSLLPGAVVLIKGTTNGTITDKQGRYAIIANEDAMLVFSIVGYKSQEIAVEKNQIINVLMDQDAMVVDLKNTGGTASNNRQSTSQNSPTTSADKVTFIVTEDLPHYGRRYRSHCFFPGDKPEIPGGCKKGRH